ncbi:MAG: N-acetylmuramoyl-L-alanine amidase-like domain-containing protein [Bacteroidota bacterium]
MKKIILIIQFSFIVLFSFAQEKSVISTLSTSSIDSLLTETAKKPITIKEKMNFFSEMFLNTDYDLECVGDGPYSQYEPWPLVNMEKTNCMSLCEHVLALSISDSWDNFFNNLQKIRYNDGIIGIKSRNHYTMADWLPENNWLLKDVTKEVGKEYTANVTRNISHKKFFSKKGFLNLNYVKDDRELNIDYIKLEELHKVVDRLEVGDIAVLIYREKEDIFAAHMVMVMVKNGEKVIREATTSVMSTIDTEISEWIRVKQEKSNKRYIGISVIRIKEEINSNKKIILPWEI